MNPLDETAMLGEQMQSFLEELTRWAEQSDGCRLHFVTAREMTNMILAACDGLDGHPGDHRDYRLQLIKPVDSTL
jgi:hypothetical protein